MFIWGKVIKRVPYLGPVIQGVGIALTTKEIIENSTPLGAVKIISGSFLKECTRLEVFIAGKYVMFLGGVLGSFRIDGNPRVVSGTMSSSRSIVKDL